MLHSPTKIYSSASVDCSEIERDTPLVTHHSSYTQRTPLITHYSSYTHHTLLILHSSHTTHHTLLILHSSNTTHHTPLITHYSSYTTHHTPLITHHSSPPLISHPHHTPLISFTLIVQYLSVLFSYQSLLIFLWHCSRFGYGAHYHDDASKVWRSISRKVAW